jgi:hypothetical protein
VQALYNRGQYGETAALAIEVMGSTAVSIANRWALGWPEQVQAMLAAGVYDGHLKRQTEHEKDVLADTYAPHLSTAEILQLHGIPPSPPALG